MTNQSAEDRGIDEDQNVFDGHDSEEASLGSDDSPAASEQSDESVTRGSDDGAYGTDEMRASYSADPGGPA